MNCVPLMYPFVGLGRERRLCVPISTSMVDNVTDNVTTHELLNVLNQHAKDAATSFQDAEKEKNGFREQQETARQRLFDTSFNLQQNLGARAHLETNSAADEHMLMENLRAFRELRQRTRIANRRMNEATVNLSAAIARVYKTHGTLQTALRRLIAAHRAHSAACNCGKYTLM